MLNKVYTNSAKWSMCLHVHHTHTGGKHAAMFVCCLKSDLEYTVLDSTVDIKKMDVTSAILLILAAILMLMESI